MRYNPRIEEVSVSGGAATVRANAPFNLNPNVALEHIARADPNAAGTSSVAIKWKQDCLNSGIHMVQTVTYGFN
jgi:hypothetical protein